MRVFFLGLISLLISTFLTTEVWAKKNMSDKRLPDETIVIDLNRYAGVWYQLYDSINEQEESNEFKKREKITSECGDTRIIYTLQPDGRLHLRNECREQKQAGKLIAITGLARSINPQNTMLKVRFDPLYLRPFEFDYWILWVDQDYKLALLGSPKALGYTILSRTPVADENLLAKAKSIAIAKGYQDEYTKLTPQTKLPQ